MKSLDKMPNSFVTDKNAGFMNLLWQPRNPALPG